MTVSSLARRGVGTLPRTVPGLNLWLDARRPGTVFANNDPVATWKDLSGMGYDLSQGTAGKRPLYQASGPSILFDISNQKYLTRTGAQLANVTVYCVCSVPTNATQRIVSERVASTSRGWALSPTSSSTNLTHRMTGGDGGGVYPAVAPAEAVGTMRVLSGTCGAANNLSISRDGTAVTGVMTNPMLVGGYLTVGAEFDGTTAANYSSASVQSVLLYSGIHNAATRKKIERWLGQQFGITVAQ